MPAIGEIKRNKVWIPSSRHSQFRRQGRTQMQSSMIGSRFLAEERKSRKERGRGGGLGKILEMAAVLKK